MGGVFGKKKQVPQPPQRVEICTDKKHYGKIKQVCIGKNCRTEVCENCTKRMMCMMCELAQDDEMQFTDSEVVNQSKIKNA